MINNESLRTELESINTKLDSNNQKLDILIEKSDDIISTDKVAELLNQSKNYILKQCRMNAIPFHKLGNKPNYYFLKSEIINYIKNNGIM